MRVLVLYKVWDALVTSIILFVNFHLDIFT